ncbi:MAG: M20 family metallopeptidase [Chloroflexi bacterium]|nr:M20 family metallopeptidase [Chloroflexota bacterium]
MVEFDCRALLSFLVQLVNINTSNPPGNEAPAARLCAEKMTELGLEAQVIDLGNHRANAVGILRGTGERPALLFSGHLDTVSSGDVSWERPPFECQDDGERVYGRGTADMKGGVAALIFAAGRIAQRTDKPKGDLILAFTAGEESDSLGAVSYVEGGGLSGVDGIVIGEPSSSQVIIAHKGALWLEITTFGKTAHGSMPDQGVNALDRMRPVLDILSEYQFVYQPHSLLTGPSLSVNTIQGGFKTNVVPDRCTVTVDMRTVPGQDHKTILEEINAEVRRIGNLIPQFEVEIKILNDRPPIETAPDAPLVRAGLEVAQTLGNRLQQAIVRGANYYTDGSVFAGKAPIPIIIYGPGEVTIAHQPNEFITIESLNEAVTFYYQVAERLLC